MYLLYIDESGNEDNPADRHFVLAGVAVFERVTYFLSQAVDDVQTKHFPGSPPIPFHISHMRSGKDFWRTQTVAKRDEIMGDLLKAVQDSSKQGVVLFAAAVEKTNTLYGEQAVEHAAGVLCTRFDDFPKRKYQEESNAQRGVLIFSEGRFHTRTRLWVKNFRAFGTKWGVLHNLADIPYFAAMTENRLLQVADLIAYAVFQLYERKDATLIKPLLNRFDSRSGVIRGLVHEKLGATDACGCPACASATMPYSAGNWV